jgi:hypothetical protein
LGEPDEKPFRSTDVAEPIRVRILDNVAYELRAAVSCDGSRCEEAGELETTVAIRH